MHTDAYLSWMRRFLIPRKIQDFSSVFHRNGYELYIVGGAVRDFYAGFKVKDYDFATNADPETVIRLFRRTVPTGIAHGTVSVLFGGSAFEVTTFRSESPYSDSRHPDQVTFIGSIEEDLKRRDFTINALAVNTVNGDLIDLHGGLQDIQKKIIRAIGDPSLRFQEDSLRMLRAFRLSAVLGYPIEQRTIHAIQQHAAAITAVSSERVQEELNKILSVQKPSLTFFSMQRAGLLFYFLPELSRCIGVGSKGPHSLDTFTHLCYACDGAPPDSLPVRLAALLHDTGKPETEKLDENGLICYHGHDSVSADKADQILRRLKYSNAVRTEVTHLIRYHMFNYTSSWTDAAVRRFISKVGEKYVFHLLLLREADYYGSTGRRLHSGKLLQELRNRITAALTDREAINISDLAVNGSLLIENGIPEGPIIGTVLKLLLEAVLDDPSLNERKTLLNIAEKIVIKHHLTD